MKIAHIITRMIAGGAQENTLLSAEGQAHLPGNEVLLITGVQTGSEGDLLAGWTGPVRIIRIPSMVRSIHPVLDLKALAAVTRVLRAERPDVVHTHSSKAGVIGRLAARLAGVPVAVHTLHSLVFHDYQPYWLNRLYRIIKRCMVPLTTHYVSVSEDIMRRAISAGLGRADRHSTVYSGFRTDEFVESLVSRAEARAKLSLPDDRVLIGVVGRLFPLKGHDEILTVATAVTTAIPDAMFVFVGSGPLESALRESVRRAGLQEHVHFSGRLAGAEMPVAYSAFDFLCHASLREGLARVIPQAILAGLPVVCYDLDGSREVVRDGIDGYLIPAQDRVALTARLIEVAGDAAVRQRLSGNHRDVVREQFSVERMVRGLNDVYVSLIAGHIA